MLKTLAEWAARKLLVLQIQERLRRLESSVTLAERLVHGLHAVDSTRVTRILLSGSERITVCGTESEIADAAVRLSRQTKNCVTVAVVVAYHHRRGCDDRRTPGVDMVGN
jgi:hypothetical protein